MPPPSKIIELRELLAAKYPTAPQRTGGFLPTELAPMDAVLHGGLPVGGLTEIVCPTGGGLLLHTLLRATQRRRGLMALIDGADTFDPSGVPAAALNRLLWVRSQTAAQALHAADLLLRDGNLSLVILDLRFARAKEIRDIPSTSWYRLQRVVEPTATAAAVLTACATVSGARPRLLLEGRFSLQAFERRQDDLLRRLHVETVRGQEEPARRYA